jgi:hypothetical protein
MITRQEFLAVDLGLLQFARYLIARILDAALPLFPPRLDAATGLFRFFNGSFETLHNRFGFDAKVPRSGYPCRCRSRSIAGSTMPSMWQ